MTKTVEIDVAQATLRQIIAELGPGDEVVILRNQHPIAKLISSVSVNQRREAGNCKNMLTLETDDEDHLLDFKEYMDCL